MARACSRAAALGATIVNVRAVRRVLASYGFTNNKAKPPPRRVSCNINIIMKASRIVVKDNKEFRSEGGKAQLVWITPRPPGRGRGSPGAAQSQTHRPSDERSWKTAELPGSRFQHIMVHAACARRGTALGRPDSHVQSCNAPRCTKGKAVPCRRERAGVKYYSVYTTQLIQCVVRYSVVCMFDCVLRLRRLQT